MGATHKTFGGTGQEAGPAEGEPSRRDRTERLRHTRGCETRVNHQDTPEDQEATNTTGSSFCGWIHQAGLPVSASHLHAMISVALATLSGRILLLSFQNILPLSGRINREQRDGVDSREQLKLMMIKRKSPPSFQRRHGYRAFMWARKI